MMKVKNLFIAIAVIGLLVSISITDVQAGSCPPVDDCANFCKCDCQAGQYKLDCSGERGEGMKECRFMNNILAQCCYFNCVESVCGIDAGDSIVCEALEELCI